MERLPTAVQRFLHGITTGDWDGMEQHFTADAVHDGSMPGWRLQYQGPDRIVRAFREEWTPDRTWELVECRIVQAPDAVVVDFEATSVGSDGSRVVDRMANIFELREGRIAEHRYYCSGEWDEATVRRIAAEAPTIARVQAR